jgi:CarD family transcriptional regulator
VDGPTAADPDDVGSAGWSRRYRTNLERLSSGDRRQVIEVVQQLATRERTVGITPGEARMLARARMMLDDLPPAR